MCEKKKQSHRKTREVAMCVENDIQDWKPFAHFLIRNEIKNYFFCASFSVIEP